jgi:Predicted membrane protein
VDIVFRAVFAYVFILFLMRIVGRRELSSMEPSDLILLIVLGDLVQNGVTQSDYSMTGVALATSTIGLLAVATSYITFRSKRAKSLIEGEPLIVLQDGKLIERNLKGERLTPDDVADEARTQGIGDLGEVKWAVLETSGKITFIKS